MLSNSARSLAMIAILFTGACGGHSPAPSNTAASGETQSTSQPREQVVAAANVLITTRYRYTLLLAAKDVRTFAATDQAVETVGDVDPIASTLAVKTSFKSPAQSYALDLRTVDGSSFLKITGKNITTAVTGKWLRIETSRISSSWISSLADATDPSGAKSLVNAIVAVQRTGAHTYRGTFDLTKVRGPLASPTQVSTLGDKARSIPFELTLDGQGRLVSIVVPSPYAKASDPGTFTFTLSNYGARVDVVAPPAGQTTTAPESLYGQLGS